MLGLGLGFIIWALFTLKKTRDFKEMVRTPLFSVAFIFMAIVAGSIANNWLFDTLFMLRRTAFFLYVLFIIMLFFAVDELSSNTHLKSRLILYSLLVFSLSAAHFVLCYDSSKYLEWGGDASIKPMLTELEHQAKSEGSTVKINLGVSWFFEPSINYYRKAYGYHTWLNKVTRDPFNANQEYFFVIEEHKKDLPETETTLIQSYPKANTLLLKNTRN